MEALKNNVVFYEIVDKIEKKCIFAVHFGNKLWVKVSTKYSLAVYQ